MPAVRGLGANHETEGAVDLQLERRLAELRGQLRHRIDTGLTRLPRMHDLTDDANGAIDDMAYALSLFEDPADAVKVVRAATAAVTAMYLSEEKER